MTAAPNPMERWAPVDTSWGPVGLAWTEHGLSGLVLPGDDSSHLGPFGAERVRAELPDVHVRTATAIRAHLAGDLQTFAEVPVDTGRCTDFEARVLDWIRGIPAGTYETYGDVARALGQPGAARAVGGALGRNPVALVLPCHRVLGSRGAAVGFSSMGGVSTKVRLLVLERAILI